MKIGKKDMLLYAVTDRAWLNGSTLYEQVEQALKGGVTCVQLREKQMNHDEFLKEAVQIGELCRNYNVPFIVNDNAQVAVECGADGLHIGQSDGEVSKTREIIGKDMILGVSAQTVEQAKKAQEDGADYLGVGAVFPTATKSDAESVSYQTLKDICTAVSVPVVAIGGINKNNMLDLSGSGIDGVALVSAIFASGDIEKECTELKKVAERTVSSCK